MQSFIRVASVITALLTGASLLAFPFLNETQRPWALFVGLGALAATFALVLLMMARFMDVIIGFAKQLEQRAKQQEGEPGA